MINFKSLMITMATVCLVSVSATAVGATTENKSSEREMIVVFEKEKNAEQVGKIKALSVVEKQSTNGEMVLMNLTEAEIQALQEDPNVKTIEENQRFTISAQNRGYAIDRIKGDRYHQFGNTGKGVKVAVIDTGIAPHPDLKIVGGKSFVDYTGSFTDDNGHGTHVAGIIGALDNDIGILGVAPEAELYSLKVMNNTGEGDLMDVVSAINWSIDNGMDVINMSIGTKGYSVTLEEAVNRAYAQGILLVGAAGNDERGGVEYPAKHSSVIAVSATNSMNNLAYFSNIGQEVEVSAPGVNIISTVLNNQYAITDGTSMATPYVAGQLALLKQAYPADTAPQLRKKLQQSVIDLGTPGRDIEFGYGLIQTLYPLSEIVLTEKTGLYNEINGTTPLLFLSPQAVSVIEYAENGWMKIGYQGMEYWAKDGYVNERVYFSKLSGLYDSQGSIVRVTNIGPQMVNIIERGDNGWVKIKTWLGDKWTKDGYTNNIHYVMNASGLYNEPNSTNRISVVSPQRVTVVQRSADGWMKINTWLGEKWMKDGYTEQIEYVYLIGDFGIYQQPNGVDYVTSASHSRLKVLDKAPNGWYLVPTWKGDLWVKNGYNVKPSPISTVKTYTVVSGDTLWAVSRKTGLSVDQIKQLNGMSSNVLRVGQKLKLN